MKWPKNKGRIIEMERYNIVRFYFEHGRRIVKRRVTLQEAQKHCKDPETSSRTCKSSAGKRRTRVYGDWFDGYEHS